MHIMHGCHVASRASALTRTPSYNTQGYLCVAGAPSPAEPEAQAQAMANMALDMIDASRRHKAPDGSQLRIRVGLHCGPVMAGVVGRKMPRWCLVRVPTRADRCDDALWVLTVASSLLRRVRHARSSGTR